ncbi:MAG: protease pro-enzyme activation domain-containing protein [Terracidiphilus sp.]
MAVLAGLALGAGSLAVAQSPRPNGSGQTEPRTLITQSVDEQQRAVLRGNTHPLTRTAVDRGAAPSGMPMKRMTLVLQRSPEQESALRTLLDDQQSKGSPSYQQWLSPEQFGKQFGPSDSDLATVETWLKSRGFQIGAISKGRIAIEFSGTASQVEEAFNTSIHKYEINGEEHWANSADPSIPSALAPVVKGVLTLHNFPRHPNFTLQASPAQAAQSSLAPSPMFTFKQGNETYYGLGPTDFATIYDVLPLWKAGIDGTGQTIAIVGETNIHLTDIENFRSLFGLPAKDPVVILNGPDPGVVGDEPEAVLDVSWSGAVAKNATIDLVVSASTETSLGVDLSALYIVDNNLAPVMSESYGECEAKLGNTGNAFYNALWQQAAAQGITVILAAGDGGSAGCDNFDAEAIASDGLAVSGFASTPYNVSVGGTDFDQTPTTAPTYWSSTNSATTGASALGYIPETTWNQSCAGLGLGHCPTNSSDLDIVAGSGGPSSCSTQDSNGKCISGYNKPAWQTGIGVPSDGVRDLPDVSMFASAGFNGSFYIMCELDAGIFGSQLPCSLTNNTFLGIGGTSASAPTFAGIMALVNQKMTAQGQSTRQGNANYILYKLAAQNGASCNSSTTAATGNSCIFHDVTKGNNSVPCAPGSPNCAQSTSNNYGVLVDPNNPTTPAWTTTAGYDLATGLGSVDAANLVNAWSTAAFTPSTTTLTNLSPLSIVHGQPVSVDATVTAKSGSATPTGSVALIASPAGGSQGIDNFPLVNGVAGGATTLLPGGTYNVTAHYAGDSVFGASDSAPMQVTVGKENSKTGLTLAEYSPTAQGFISTSTVPYGSIFFVRSDVTGAAGTACAPNPTESAAACPTGSVSLTTNGASDGTSALNSLGYMENQTLFQSFGSLGNYTLGANYSGDSSYAPSATTLTATVTQAPTETEPGVYDLSHYNGGTGAFLAWSGQAFRVIVPVYTQSVLQAPTGVISILQNGNPPSGAITYIPRNGSYSAGYIAYLAGTLNTSIDTPGNYTFTASYPGDAHYLGSQGDYSIPVLVVDTTFNMTTPIPNVTIAASGQTGTTTATLNGVDNFVGTINLTCTLPAVMTEATCPAVTANLGNNTTATAQLTITTTAPHPLTTSRLNGKGLYGFGLLACVFLFGLPGSRRRRFPLALLMLGCVTSILGCGGGASASSPPVDQGTPAGTYTVNVTATSMGITRTGTFTVTVQ